MMVACITVLCFLLAYGCASALRNAALGPSAPQRLHTFAVDPPTFFIVGLVAAFVGMLNLKGRALTKGEFLSRKRIIDVALVLFALGFWTLESLAYFNVTAHPFDPAKTGNDFMWNGYLEWFVGPLVDTTVPTFTSARWNLFALALWILQPLALLWGRSIGYGRAAAKVVDPR
jgi:hypothetical protein